MSDRLLWLLLLLIVSVAIFISMAILEAVVRHRRIQMSPRVLRWVMPLKYLRWGVTMLIAAAAAVTFVDGHFSAGGILLMLGLIVNVVLRMTSGSLVRWTNKPQQVQRNV